MIKMTLAEVAAAVGGQLQNADPETLVTGSVEFDTRKLVPGSLFVALVGENNDGHDFAAQAVAQGAVAVLASKPLPGLPTILCTTAQVQLPPGSEAAASGNAPVLGALASLAHHVWEKLKTQGLLTFGVTGSSGKTSAKDMLAAVLQAHFGQVIANEGSLNNEIGLPYTVLRCTDDTKVLVLEYSARGVGHINYLTGIACPDFALELNVGHAHVGEFGSQEVIARAKAELLAAATTAGILNAADPWVQKMPQLVGPQVPAELVWYAAQPLVAGTATPTVWVDPATITTSQSGCPEAQVVVAGETFTLALQVMGNHQLINAAAIIAAGLQVGVPVAEMLTVLKTYQPRSPHRMQLLPAANGLTVVDDAYNANPESMAAAISALFALETTGRRFAVLWPMGELGDQAAAAHSEIGTLLGDLAAAAAAPTVLVTNPQQPALAALSSAFSAAAGKYGEVLTVAGDDPELAVSALAASSLKQGEVVLCKASHAFKRWLVAEQLCSVATAN